MSEFEEQNKLQLLEYKNRKIFEKQIELELQDSYGNINVSDEIQKKAERLFEKLDKDFHGIINNNYEMNAILVQLCELLNRFLNALPTSRLKIDKNGELKNFGNNSEILLCLRSIISKKIPFIFEDFFPYTDDDFNLRLKSIKLYNYRIMSIEKWFVESDSLNLFIQYLPKEQHRLLFLQWCEEQVNRLLGGKLQTNLLNTLIKLADENKIPFELNGKPKTQNLEVQTDSPQNNKEDTVEWELNKNELAIFIGAMYEAGLFRRKGNGHIEWAKWERFIKIGGKPVDNLGKAYKNAIDKNPKDDSKQAKTHTTMMKIAEHLEAIIKG